MAATAITRSGLTRLFTGILVVLSVLQGSVLSPTFPIANAYTKAVVSAVIMFLVVGLTAWKQYLSVEIKNAAIWPTVIVAVAATLGGLNDLIGVIHVSATTAQWSRFIITTAAMILAIISKSLFPTPASNYIEEQKSQIAFQVDRDQKKQK